MLEKFIDELPTVGVTAFIVQIANWLLKKKQVSNESKKTLSEIEKSNLEMDLKSFELLKSTWKEEFSRYEEKIEKLWTTQAKLEDKVHILEVENESLRQQLIQLKALHPEMPIPMWLKDYTGKMLSLNQSYEDAFLFPLGKTRADYIGFYDEDIWGKDIAEVFRANDHLAMAQKKFIELDNEHLKHPLFQGWVFYKYPVFSEGTFIGVAGLGLPKDKELKHEIKS